MRWVRLFATAVVIGAGVGAGLALAAWAITALRS